MIFQQFNGKYYYIITQYKVEMAKNTGDGTRQGMIKDRSQFYNEKTGMYVKRGGDGKIMSQSKNAYKGVKLEKK